MRYFEIALPVHDNAGLNTFPARKLWEKEALKFAGGFTRLPVSEGAWQDGDKLYVERMQFYRLACEPQCFATLVDRAFELFPDQLAIFHADLGTATIANRPAVAA